MCRRRTCHPVLDSLAVQVHGADPIIVRPVMALLTREAMSALVPITSRGVPTFRTRLLGVVRIHRDRAGLIQGRFIFKHRRSWKKAYDTDVHRSRRYFDEGKAPTPK